VKLITLINADNVLLDGEASSREQALAVIAQSLSSKIGVEPETIARSLVEREQLGSTSVGDEFAIPHCKLPGMKKIWIFLARFTEGLDFKAGNGTLARFLFVVLSPPDQPAAHLQVLSQIARLLKRRELRQELLQAPDAASVIAAVERVAELEGL